MAARSLLISRWHHERVVVRAENGCEVRDLIQFEPRLRWLGWWLEVYHRFSYGRFHTRLRTRYAQI